MGPIVAEIEAGKATHVAKMCTTLHSEEGTFSLIPRRGRGLDFLLGRPRSDQGFVELEPEKKILTIGGTPQNGSVKQRNRTRQLGLVDECDWHFKGDLGPGIEVSLGG